MKAITNLIVLIIQTFLGFLIWSESIPPKAIGLYWFLGGMFSLVLYSFAWAYGNQEEEE